MATPRGRNSLPSLPDELIEEILLRLPTDDPGCLLRASVLSKSWSHSISCPAFRSRLCELHRRRTPRPPLLGFVHNWDNDQIPRFVPTTASKFFLAAPDRSSWRALDCRHGRVLFLSTMGKLTLELLVWEPITGRRFRVPVSEAFKSNCGTVPTAAVLCAADGCDHLDCHGGPFRVVLAFDSTDADVFTDDADTSVCVYSSETDSWGEPTLTHSDCIFDFSYGYSSVLVGCSILYFMSDGSMILEYDLAGHRLTVFHTPPVQIGDHERFNLMLGENGGLGAIEDVNPDILLWSMVAYDRAGVPEGFYPVPWVLSRVINLDALLPFGASLVYIRMGNMVLGFAGRANVIFVNTAAGLFTVNLQSECVSKVCDHHADPFKILFPLVSFYTPLPRDMEQRQPLKHGDCEVVTPIAPLSPKIGYWWCLTCQCVSKDVASYSDHLNNDMFRHGGRAYHEKFDKRLPSLLKSGDPYRFSEQGLDKKMLKRQQQEEEERKGNKKKKAEQDETEEMDPGVAVAVAAMMGLGGVGTSKE